MNSSLIVVVGSGPGIGVRTASLFATRNFNVALLSRNAERLKDDQAVVQAANKSVKVNIYPVDTADHEALKTTLNRVTGELGKPEVVLFNAARIAMTTIGETTPEFILEDFKSMNIGLYTTATWALPQLTSLAGQSGRHPAFFLSGGAINARPVASLFSLSMQKAAQHNFMESLSIFAGSKGVHVAIVNIGGIVSDEDPVINAESISSTYWRLYGQEKSNWRFDVHVGDVDDMIRDLAGKGIY